MTIDKLVDDKTRTSRISWVETLSSAKLCWFYYLAVARRLIAARPLRSPPVRAGRAPRRSCKRHLLGAWRQNRALDAARGAKRPQGTLAGVEKTGVAHDA